jgi:hypothetical protein
MTSRRLEARIKKLCEEALRAEQRELEVEFHELRAAIREYIEFVGYLATNRVSLSRPASMSNPSPRKRNGH